MARKPKPKKQPRRREYVRSGKPVTIGAVDVPPAMPGEGAPVQEGDGAQP